MALYTPPQKNNKKQSNRHIKTIFIWLLDKFESKYETLLNIEHCKHNTVNCGVRVKISSLRILPKLGVDLYGGYNTFNTEL